MRRLIDRYLDVDDATAAESRERVRAVFDEVGGRLSDGRRFLVGDAFTAADLTFAALAAAVLIPSRYGVPLPPARGAARAVRRARCGRCASTRRARFALRLYDQERPYTQRR